MIHKSCIAPDSISVLINDAPLAYLVMQQVGAPRPIEKRIVNIKLTKEQQEQLQYSKNGEDIESLWIPPQLCSGFEH